MIRLSETIVRISSLVLIALLVLSQIDFVCVDYATAEEAGKTKQLGISLPKLSLEIMHDGGVARRSAQSHCPHVAIVWHQLLQQPSVQDELEMIVSQKRDLAKLLRPGAFDANAFRMELDRILLPHQINELAQITARFCCLATGIQSQLIHSPVFKHKPLDSEELAAVQERLSAIEVRFHAATQRELALLDTEVRKTLSAKQVRLIVEMIGDRQLLDVTWLDFAILQLEEVGMENIYDEIDKRSFILGRSSQYQLRFHGQLTPVNNSSPFGFFNGFTQLLSNAEIRLSRERLEMLRAYQDELVMKLSTQSKAIYHEVESERLRRDEAKRELVRFANREAQQTIGFFEILLSQEEWVRVERAALQRELRQRGALSLLVDGYISQRLLVTPEQRKRLRELTNSKLEKFHEVARSFETQVWQGVALSLSPERRVEWNKEYGDGQFTSLPGSPYLLLFRPKSSN